MERIERLVVAGLLQLEQQLTELGQPTFRLLGEQRADLSAFSAAISRTASRSQITAELWATERAPASAARPGRAARPPVDPRW